MITATDKKVVKIFHNKQGFIDLIARRQMDGGLYFLQLSYKKMHQKAN